MTRSANRFERYSKIITPVLIFILMILTDLGAAQVYKLLYGESWGEAPRNRALLGEKIYRIKSNIYDHGLSPNAQLKGFWGNGRYDFATNSMGFKDFAPREVSLVSDKHRILFIGDSFTEGVGLTYADTFVGMISKELEKNNIETFNAGVVSYSPIIYWRKIKHLIEDVGLKFDEVVVFLDISDAKDEFDSYYLNDAGEVQEVSPIDETKKKKNFTDFLQENTICVFYIYEMFLYKLDGRFKRVFANENFGRLNKSRALWTGDPKIFKEYGEKGLSNMEKSMDRLYSLLKEHGIKLTVAVYPWPDQIVRNEINSIQVSYWGAWAARKKDVQFLNYFPDFIPENCDSNCHKRVLNQYFIKADIHWNRAGNRLIADKFISFYKNERL